MSVGLRRPSWLGAFVAAVFAGSGMFASYASADPPDLTWSGLAPAGGAGPSWSDSRNWQDALIPASNGAIQLPALTSPACTAATPTGTCYWSNNDLTGLNVTGVTIDDGAPYRITGNQVGLGAGGITAAPSANDTGDSPFVWLPFNLTAPQTWSITGGGANSGLALAGAVTGSSTPLTIAFNGQAFLALYADAEVGDITVTGNGGPSTLQIGHPDNPAALNSTTGNPINISGGVNVVADPAATGPLTISGGRLQVGDAERGDTLTVNGGVTLDSTTTASFYIRRPGTRAGTDFSQLSAAGNVNLGGASLDLSGLMGLGETQACPVLTPGDVDTLVTTTGSLTGTFAGIPDGSTIQLTCPAGSLQAPTVQINYTAHAVTATVMSSDGTPSATSLSANPAGTLTTNQSVTLTATVSAGSNPIGTVEFDNNGEPVAGCLDRRLVEVGGSATATCQTSFAAAAPGVLVTAIFRPQNGTLLQGSSDSTDLVVDKGTTTTTLSISDPAPTTGQTVTYSAAVAPGQAGVVQPQGVVQFLDDGAPIDGCSNQPLSVGASSSVATCSLSYSAPGSHHIAATYAGDANFSGSTSSDTQAVTVEPAPISGGSGPPATADPPTTGSSSSPTSGGPPAPGSSSSPTSGAPSATPTSSAAPVSSAASAPRCRLTLARNRVLPIANHPAMLRLNATCAQDVAVTVQGILTIRPPSGAQSRNVLQLAPRHTSMKEGRSTAFVIRLPKAALPALRRGRRETAVFTLSAASAGGATRVLLRVASLRL